MESKTVVDHCKAPRGQDDPLTVGPRDGVAFCERVICKSGVGRNVRSRRIELTPAKRREQVAGEDDALALPAGEPINRQVLDSSFQCLTDFAPKSDIRQDRGLPDNEPVVEPRRAACPHLRLDRQIRADRKH